MRALIFPSLLLLAACELRSDAEDWSAWYDEGVAYDVQEPLSFTTENYGLPRAGEGLTTIADLQNATIPESYGTRIAAADYDAHLASCGWDATPNLPAVIEGVITAHPRMYFKAIGCTPDSDPSNNDEKYYGSFFIEDDSGGIFVLGDSKVAHFDMGDTVRMTVRGVRRDYGLNMVYVHDVDLIERNAAPIKYVEATRPLSDADLGEVRRVTGTIVSEPTTFGDLILDLDGYGGCTTENESADSDEFDDDCIVVSVDMELSGRGVTFTPGERVTLTGPVTYTFRHHRVVITRVGQIERHTD